jgi:hypothetical protein
MNIEPGLLEKDGLYIYFKNGKILDLSKERIQTLGNQYWKDVSHLSNKLQRNKSLYLECICMIIPSRPECSAMKPLLPILDELESFSSHDNVGALYVDRGIGHYFSTISLQHALKYLSDISLFDHCECTKKFRKYFRGIDPFMETKEAGCRLFMNIYWIEKGDRQLVNQIVKEMQKVFLFSARCCSKRLDNFCRSDALMNAYVISHGILFTLSMDIDRILNDYFDSSSPNTCSI